MYGIFVCLFPYFVGQVRDGDSQDDRDVFYRAFDT